MILPVHSAESSMLKSIGKYVPSLTEVGYLANLANLYVQVSQYVRSTNHLIRSVKSAKKQYSQVKSEINKLMGQLENLKHIDPYNMNTWASTLRHANHIVSGQTRNIINAFNLMEYYAVDQTMIYGDRLGVIAEYDIRNRHNRLIVSEYFAFSSWRQNLEELQLASTGYGSNYLMLKRSQIAEYQKLCEVDPDNCEVYGEAIKKAEEDMERVENIIRSAAVETNSMDLVIQEIHSLVGENLTQIQVMSQQVIQMEKSANNLVAAYYKLKGGELNTVSTENDMPIAEFSMALDEYNSTDPDNVAPPGTPEIISKIVKYPGKKEASEHDILNLQNAAQYLALKQESLLRDIESLKANTAVFLVLLEGKRQQLSESSAFMMAHGSKRLEYFYERW